MKQESVQAPRRRRRRRKSSEDKPAEEKKLTKKKLHKPNVIQAGSLREQVKIGNFTAREVLDWLVTQPGPHSPKFESWLRRKVKE